MKIMAIYILSSFSFCLSPTSIFTGICWAWVLCGRGSLSIGSEASGRALVLIPHWPSVHLTLRTVCLFGMRRGWLIETMREEAMINSYSSSPLYALELLPLSPHLCWVLLKALWLQTSLVAVAKKFQPGEETYSDQNDRVVCVRVCVCVI